MLNSIKADIYRLLHGKGIYITLIIFIGIMTLMILTNAQGSIGVSSTTISTRETTISWNGMSAATWLSQNPTFLTILLIPFFILVFGTDLDHHTIKNTISRGESRVRYLTSKVMVVVMIMLVFTFIYYAFGITLATLMNGFGGSLNGDYIFSLLKVVLPQLYITFSIMMLGILILYLSKSTTLTCLSIFLIPMFFQIISISFLEFEALKGIGQTLIQYDMFSGLNEIAHQFVTQNVINYCIMATIVLFGSYTLTIYRLQKQDIS